MRRPTFGLLLVLASGCSLISPRPASYDFYVLTPVARDTASGSEPDAPILVIARVTLPDYLDRDSMVTRVGMQRIVYSKQDRWAEPLAEGIARTLRHDLGFLLGPRLLVQPQRFGTTPDYSVSVDIIHFERIGPREFELAARFTLLAGGRVLHAGDTQLVEPTEDASAAATAAASSRALARFSDDIAAAVRTLVSDS